MRPWKQHRPLLCGLRIAAVSKNDDGTYTEVNKGTMGALAIRTSDNRKVLVTCHHVMADGIINNAASGVEMHQPDFTDRIGGTATYSATTKVGTLLDKVDWTNLPNEVDVAICDLEPGVDAKHLLHLDPVHTARKIIQGG